MKHLFKILFATVFLSVFNLINLGYAVPPPSQPVVTVQVTIQNQSSAASLKHWDFSYTRSFPDMPLYMPALFPVNPNSSGQPPLSIKIPIQQPAISASLLYGYDSDNFCLFLFSYSNNHLTVTPTPHGGVNCGTPVVSGKSVTLTINQRGQQQQQSATNYIHFTIVNDSSKSLKYYKPPIVSPNWLKPMSISPSLATIPANSSLSFTATINHSLPTGTSVQIDYGIDANNFCIFSLPIRQLKIKATVIKTTKKSTKYHMICTVGNDNSMHLNVQLPSHLGAKCNQSGHWSYKYHSTNTTAVCSNLECEADFLMSQQSSSCSSYNKHENSFNNGSRGAAITIYTDDDSYATNSFIYCDVENALNSQGGYARISNLPHYSMKRECAYLLSQDPHLNFNYGN